MTEPESMIKVSREEICLFRSKTDSGIPVKEVYNPDDIADLSHEDIGDPGKYPFTRGTYPQMYRRKLWLRSASIGYGTPEETNRATKKFIAAGLVGPRFVTDTPTMAGIDPDHPMAATTLAANGMPLFALPEWEIMLDGIDLDGLDIECPLDTSSSGYTFYIFLLALAEGRGFEIGKLRGSLINDPIHSHLVVMDRDFPVDIAKRVTTDIIEFDAKYTPRFYPFVPCGYDLSEGGANAYQEIGLDIGIAIQYMEDAKERGINIEELPPVAFSLCGKMDFFETIAKCRAIRKIWARVAKDRLGISDPRKMACRIGMETAGSASQLKKPINNISRLTIEMLAAVLGGCQSVNPTQIAEQHGLASDESRIWDQDVHHIIAHETNVALTADPLGGSYYVEWLTSEIEEKATEFLKEVDQRGGMWECLKSGWLEGQIFHSVMTREREINNKERILVGTNMFQGESGPISKAIEDSVYKRPLDQDRYKAIEKFRKFKELRNEDETGRALAKLYQVAKEGGNIIRPAIEAAKALATQGELVSMVRIASGYSYDPFEMVAEPKFIRHWIEK